MQCLELTNVSNLIIHNMGRLAFIFQKLNLIILSCCVFCYCCAKKDSRLVYQSGRVWLFNAYFYNESKVLTDTIEVKMGVGSYYWLSLFSGQKRLSFEYAGIKENTGFIEDKEYVFLHPPREKVFAFTEILPMPEVLIPPSIISESKIELKTVKRFNQLNHQTISQKRKQMNETEEFDYNGNRLLCYKIEGWNVSHVEEFGQYKVTYFYNENYGFVRFLYEKPNGSIVDIKLKQTNFE
jgi:hypothetical protein